VVGRARQCLTSGSWGGSQCMPAPSSWRRRMPFYLLRMHAPWLGGGCAFACGFFSIYPAPGSLDALPCLHRTHVQCRCACLRCVAMAGSPAAAVAMTTPAPALPVREALAAMQRAVRQGEIEEVRWRIAKLGLQLSSCCSRLQRACTAVMTITRKSVQQTPPRGASGHHRHAGSIASLP
jgi:hypothetical protein